MSKDSSLFLFRGHVQFRPRESFGIDLDQLPFQIPANRDTGEHEPATLFFDQGSRVVHVVPDSEANHVFTYDPNSGKLQ